MAVKNSKIVVTEKYTTKSWELSTQDLQKGNIDLSKMSAKSRQILCVFDTKKKDGSSGSDGYLSRQEISNALDYFSKFASEDLYNDDYKEQEGHFNYKEQVKCFKSLAPQIAKKTGMKYSLNDTCAATFVKVTGNKISNRVDVVYHDIQSALIELKGLIDNKKKEEAQQMSYNNLKLQPTKKNKDLYKGADGNFYRLDSSSNKYVKLSNVESVDYNSYTKKAAFGKYGWTVSTIYTSDGKERAIQLNKSNGSVERDRDKVAKAFGLSPEYTYDENIGPYQFTGRYIDAGTGGVYSWDEMTRCFVNAGVKIDYKWTDNKITNRQEVFADKFDIVDLDSRAIFFFHKYRSDEEGEYQFHFYPEDK